jgi:hypothetical protein
LKEQILTLFEAYHSRKLDYVFEEVFRPDSFTPAVEDDHWINGPSFGNALNLRVGAFPTGLDKDFRFPHGR